MIKEVKKHLLVEFINKATGDYVVSELDRRKGFWRVWKQVNYVELQKLMKDQAYLVTVMNGMEVNNVILSK